jgi:hypothetical protein
MMATPPTDPPGAGADEIDVIMLPEASQLGEAVEGGVIDIGNLLP